MTATAWALNLKIIQSLTLCSLDGSSCQVFHVGLTTVPTIFFYLFKIGNIFASNYIITRNTTNWKDHLLFNHSFFVDSFSAKEIRMNTDESYASLLLAALLVIVTQKQVSHMLIELLLKLSRPGATVALLALLLFVYTRHLHYTFLLLGLITVILLKDLWTNWIRSDSRRLYLETGRDEARFDHSTSIDLQMADGTVKHAPPSIYHSDWQPKLLVFPPSSDVQQEMNG